MKKLLVLILALVMIMSLTACGGETIEITTDNWQDYLLVKQEIIVEDILNDFEEIETRYAKEVTFLCLKDEYAGRNVSRVTNISVEYKCTMQSYRCSFGADGTPKVEEKIFSPYDFSDIIKNSNYDNAYEALDEYKLVLVIDNGGGESSVEMKEDFEITRIEGTLVLE